MGSNPFWINIWIFKFQILELLLHFLPKWMSKKNLREFIGTMRVPKGDLYCQCILSIFSVDMHQFYANILALYQCFIYMDVCAEVGWEFWILSHIFFCPIVYRWLSASFLRRHFTPYQSSKYTTAINSRCSLSKKKKEKKYVCKKEFKWWLKSLTFNAMISCLSIISWNWLKIQ